MLCLLNIISRSITVNVKINGLTRWTENDLKWKLFFPCAREYLDNMQSFWGFFLFSCVFFKSLAWSHLLPKYFWKWIIKSWNFEKRPPPVQNMLCKWRVCFHSAFLLRLSIHCGLKKFHSPYPKQFHSRIISVTGPHAVI